MAMPDLREFKVFTTASGARIYSIPVEAFPHFWAYVYLVVQDDWRVLIDCGSGSERSNASLETGLMQAGVSFQDLTHILITHGHIDHFGGLTYYANVPMPVSASTNWIYKLSLLMKFAPPC